MRTLTRVRRLVAIAIALGGTGALARAQTTQAATDSTRSIPVNLRGTGPNGATLRCRDGSYPAPFAAETACEAKGGVLVRFRVRGSPPPPLVRSAPVAPVAPVAPAAVAAPALIAQPSRANERIPAPQIPANATMQCEDETFVIADTSATRCAGRGGVRIRLLPNRKP